MHYYIVDAQKLSQRQYERVQHELYSSLSAFKVSGEVVRITGVRTMSQLVETAISRSATTVIAVGTDETFDELVNASIDKDVVLGFIPIMDCELGNILGISDIEHGAKTIAGRRIAELDLGSVNDSYFTTKLSFGLMKQEQGLFGSIKSLFDLPTYEIKFSAVGKFEASAQAVGGMIINGRDNGSTKVNLGNPADGMLDILLLPKLTNLQILKYRSQILSGFYENITGSSLVHANKLEIINPAGLPLRAGNKIIAKTPATIEVMPKAIKVIVGRERNF